MELKGKKTRRTDEVKSVLPVEREVLQNDHQGITYNLFAHCERVGS